MANSLSLSEPEGGYLTKMEGNRHKELNLARFRYDFEESLCPRFNEC